MSVSLHTGIWRAGIPVVIRPGEKLLADRVCRTLELVGLVIAGINRPDGAVTTVEAA